MAQPEWVTESGNLGTYPSSTDISIQLDARAILPATNLTYNLQSGSLPLGILNNLTLSSSGLISGNPKPVSMETMHEFTVRVTDENGNIRDRTFSISIAGIIKPELVTPKGEIMNVIDSKWVEYQLEYSNPLNEEIVISVTTGTLPPGLEVTANGLIYGYPKPPLSNNLPTTKTYVFSLSINSSLGVFHQTYSITVRNHALTHPRNTRAPVILNSRPQNMTINKVDPFYDYYMIGGRDSILVDSNSYMSFKVIGKDFDENDIIYEYNNLPLGLVGDTKTGWITGIPQLQFQGISKFQFNVRVAKAYKPAIVSDFIEYFIIVKKDVAQDIVWISESNLGTLLNGSISELSVTASSAMPLKYRLTSGQLPPNVELLDNGLIVGRAAFQPTEDLLPLGDKTKFEFEIEAFNTEFVLLSSKKTFSLIVEQHFDIPVENVYIKAVPSIPQRKSIYELLNNEAVFPTELLYRPRDPYFGKSSFISFVHIYGQFSATLEKYLSAMSINHYPIQLVVGDVKTAVARDSNGNIVYEVVYCDIVDENTEIGKVAKDVFWPREISRNLGPYDTGASEIFTSDSYGNKFNTSLSPGSIRMLHPASLINMRTQLSDVLGQNLDNNILPTWMTCQQLDGTIIGYKPAWVICYTNPGQSETIRNNVIDNFGVKLNDIDFTVDRYIIDKSATFNWNSYLSIPAWTELPSANPTPSPLDSNDLVVVFPEKSILPKNI